MEGKGRSRLIVKPRLKEILEDKNMTQEQLAEKTGVSQGTISRFDSSRMHQDWILFAISAALECSIGTLFEVREETIDD